MTSRANSRPIEILRMPHVCKKLGVSRATVYSWLNQKGRQYDETFPRPIAIGARAVGWSSAALDEWLSARPVSY